MTNTLVWTGLLSLAAFGLMSALLGRLPFANPWAGMFILIFALSGTYGIGFAFAALTLRIRETGQTVANALQFLLLVLCAYFFPFSALPEWMRGISRLLPRSYAVDAFRSTLMGLPPGFPELAPIGTETAIVIAFGLAMPVAGYGLYRWAEVYARRMGSLSEY